MDFYNRPEERHMMVCERTLDNGIDVFSCPLCGRKLLIQWAPIIRQAVLAPGDESVVHSAAPLEQSNLNGYPSDYSSGDYDSGQVMPDPADHVRLQQWDELLAAMDFDSWWRRPLIT